jgi:hypothetical protein
MNDLPGQIARLGVNNPAGDIAILATTDLTRRWHSRSARVNRLNQRLHQL